MEEAGIPTTAIFISAFRHIAEEMKLSRVVVTRHPMGRPLGPAGDHATHRRVVKAALDLLDGATGRIVDLPEPFVAGGSS
jgi:hypothetical protein